MWLNFEDALGHGLNSWHQRLFLKVEYMLVLFLPVYIHHIQLWLFKINVKTIKVLPLYSIILHLCCKWSADYCFKFFLIFFRLFRKDYGKKWKGEENIHSPILKNLCQVIASMMMQFSCGVKRIWSWGYVFCYIANLLHNEARYHLAKIITFSCEWNPVSLEMKLHILQDSPL